MGVLEETLRKSTRALEKRGTGSKKKSSLSESKTLGVTPKQHQEVVRQHINEEDSRGLVIFHGLGTGKTLTSIFAAETFLKQNKGAKVIVVLSASVKKQFEEEVSKNAKKPRKYEFYSRQEFVRKGSGIPKTCRGNMIIVDEAHNVRNADGKITKAIVSCTDTAAKVLLLSATPLVNAIHEIGSMVRMITPRSRIPLKHNSFTSEFGEDGLKNERRIKRLLKDKISFYVAEGNKTGFPREEFYEVFVPMERRQCEIYDGVMKGKFSSKLEKVISDPSAMAKALVFFQKPRQFCNIVKEGGVRYQPKIDALSSRVVKTTSRGGKCVVYSQYLDAGLNPIAKILKKNEVDFRVISGDTSKDDKEVYIKDYNSGKISALLLSRTAGEGLDLKETSEIHILEPHFHMSSIQQVKGRGIRYKSHKDPDAVVKVFVYFAKKCEDAKKSSKSHKTQSMDVVLWYLNKEKQKRIDKFTDRVIIPSSIERSEYKFSESSEDKITNVIEYPSRVSKRSSKVDDEMWV